jgi:hypothetical protein
VKNKIRILSVVIFASIYCFAISVVNKSHNNTDIFTHQTSSQETEVTSFSVKQFFHTAQSENGLTNFNNIPAPSLKNTFTHFWTVVKTTEHLFNSKIFQYSNFFQKPSNKPSDF